ncbi:hypothetical protein BHU24_27270 [Bacillus pseudomycoides]|jgi:hypothetical protein|uniref:Group II intron reverse transcriptase/maturase n=2 Tax=Bacillus pseudomycoides TaxID=64104 RepID=A0AAJ3R9G4_9BACI|nr:hypothetical protein [Bacillus pseudomycoides]MBD5798529.1 hypothetical protein [Bacillus pseudomycoides]MCR8855785.1 hypothetical protein [Bacillus pseudomycoides]MDR4329771.1 hypothetical protein [Bacillus pseudomycoides]MED1476674.1 hypothetical protein [Bacillus pseudomycoides]MED1539187.1 hypothetical protein [Bacillus pseudomycoides]
MKEGKSFEISQYQVLEAYKRVKANRGAGGIDGVDFTEFDKDLKNNLYKLWNRMSSGSYFPNPVKGVEIPKKNGKKRLLGIPTISDRIAQMVVRMNFEPLVELIFCASEARKILDFVNLTLVRFIRFKYKTVKRSKAKAFRYLVRMAKAQPNLFYHWQMGIRPTIG